MDVKRMPIAIANDISEFLYLHLLLAITTAVWQSSGRCKKEEIVLSPVCLLISGAHSLSAGGRSTRLVGVVLRSWSNSFCSTRYVTLQNLSLLNGRCRWQWSRCRGKEFYHFQRCLHLFCASQHNRHDLNFSKSKGQPNAMCCSINEENFACFFYKNRDYHPEMISTCIQSVSLEEPLFIQSYYDCVLNLELKS